MSQRQEPKKKKSFFRTFAFLLTLFCGIIVFAYGFTATQFNLAETSEPERQNSLVNIIQSLFQPAIFEYNKESITVDTEIYIPCPAEGVATEQASIDTSKPYVLLTPSCGDQDTLVQVEGYNFFPKKQVSIYFIPPSKALIPIGRTQTDTQGHFIKQIKLPEREDPSAQIIEVTTTRNIGMPYFTQSAKDTWDKILETIFLALLATTFGLIVSVPLSFLAAKNLMEDIKGSMVSILLYLILIPLGFWLMVTITSLLRQLTVLISRFPYLDLVEACILIAAIYFLFRLAIPQEEDIIATTRQKAFRILAMIGIGILGILALQLTTHFLVFVGNVLTPILGPMDFLAKFIGDLGSLLNLLIVVLTGIGGVAIAMGIGGKLGQHINRTMSDFTNKLVVWIISPIAFAFVAFLFGGMIGWLYKIDNPWQTLYLPAIIGGGLGLMLAPFIKPKREAAFGLVIYYLIRTLCNLLRAIEPMVYAIIFVVWVGIGPFAGVLALSLHTIAALTKLFSEQVESILGGPLEAIKATGANRLQIIVYAVIPQIVPPYISLTMYRWDVNVRMSTIIGFVGGGGIGFLLYQNIQHLQYRAASVQMIAIAIVVASMDYISEKLRARAV
jgi:phosphonate ABC transporter permease subunit PhnE